MVYKDYWALAQWYAHYGKLLGAVNLYIVAHGKDDEISRICPDASVIVIPRDDLNGFDQVRARFLNQIKDALCVFYDRVIRTDADELIVLDPERFATFQDVFEAHRGSAVFALGLDLVELAGARWAVFNSHYSKAWTSRAGMQLLLHGVKVHTSRQPCWYIYQGMEPISQSWRLLLLALCRFSSSHHSMILILS